MGDGKRSLGILDGDAGVMRAIVSYRSLEPATLEVVSLEMLMEPLTGKAAKFSDAAPRDVRGAPPGTPIELVVQAFRDPRGVFYHDARQGKIYFYIDYEAAPRP
jgi:hypothetical protein